MTPFKAPTSSSLSVHHIDALKAGDSTHVPGVVKLSIFNDGYEAFDLVLFTSNGPMAAELAAAINGVLAKHNFLYGAQPEAQQAAA